MKLLVTMTMRLPEQQQKQKKKPCRQTATVLLSVLMMMMMMMVLLIIQFPFYTVDALITTRQQCSTTAASPPLRAIKKTRTALASPWRTTKSHSGTTCTTSRIQQQQQQQQQHQQNPFFWSNSYNKATLFSGTAITSVPRWFVSSNDDGNSSSSSSTGKTPKEKKSRCFPWPTNSKSGQTSSSSLTSSSLTSTTTTRQKSSFLRRLLTTRPSSSSSSSSSSLAMSVNDDEDGDNKFPFDIKTASGLVGGQSMLIVVGILFAWLLKTPNFGFGASFALLNNNKQAAIYAGFLYTIPLVILAVVLEYVEDYIPALQDVSLATQRSVLLLLGGTFRPVIGSMTALALGLAAGVGEELIFRGIFQYELAQRIMNWSWMSASSSSSSALLFGMTNSNILAIVLSSLVFGGLHAVTKWYAILATLASLYFGFMFAATGNLAVPIICHALYDIGALIYAHWTVSQMSPQEQQKVADWDG